MVTFESITGEKFISEKISLVRASRKRDFAQIDGHNANLKLAIEFDGEFAHGNRNPSKRSYTEIHADDCETTEALLNAGYRVVRIRQHSWDAKLPDLQINVNNLVDHTYAENLLQVSYKSFGKDADNIEEIVKMIVEMNFEWFIRFCRINCLKSDKKIQ